MNHIDDETCLDFVRRLLPPAPREKVEQHLDEGCERCNKLYRLWRTVARIAGREAGYEPDEPIVHSAKGLWRTVRSNSAARKPAKFAHLLFDSLLMPASAFAGLRSASSAERRLLHRLGGWVIDLRLQRLNAKSISVAGQVLRSGRKPAAPESAEIVLTRGETVVTRTAANQFGEFQLECEYAKDLKIYVEIVGCEPIAIAIPDAAA